jgi:meso-butanediol dehydrogenase / (S,S)-butanediol dehydrogenase / diacetyl reductase
MRALMAERGISLDVAYRILTQHTPLRRPATAEEIATCILFLASDESSIVSGTTLVADLGGLAVDIAEIEF